MFPHELELSSVVANPKGGNQALFIRIRGRPFFEIFAPKIIENGEGLKHRRPLAKETTLPAMQFVKNAECVSHR